MAERSGREGLRLKLIGIAYLLVWRVARLLPLRYAAKLFDRSSARSFRRNERRRGIVRDNLEPVVGPGEALDVAVPEAFKSYGRYWMETFRMQDLSSAELTRRFGGENLDSLDAIHKRGRGGVLATPHLGNWDAGGRWVAERWPLTVVVEVLRPRMLFDRFVAHRRSLGMTIVPLVRGGDATARCLEKIREGGYVALVSDRDLSGSGVEVTMFGRKTKMPPGPAVLALRAGAPLIPACIYMTDVGWHAWVMDPIDHGITGETPQNVAALTQRLAEAYERLIAREPTQWHAFSQVWLPSQRISEAPPASTTA
ncbi:MAG: phosphatidylinositol mannoside acyltransferase [Actinomycetota bacterium]